MRAIAQDHGCSIAEVNKALDLFAVVNAKVRTHTLALELSRLDELQSVFYERAKAGDVASGMLLTKIMERRSCLVRSCLFNGNAEFPFGRQWAASVPSAGVVARPRVRVGELFNLLGDRQKRDIGLFEVGDVHGRMAAWTRQCRQFASQDMLTTLSRLAVPRR